MGAGKITIFNIDHQSVFEGQFTEYLDATDALASSEEGRVAIWEQTNPACGDEDCLCALIINDSDAENIMIVPKFGKEIQVNARTPFARLCQTCDEATENDTLAAILDVALGDQLPN